MDDMTETLQMIKTHNAILSQSVASLEKSDTKQWEAIDKIKDSLSVIKSQIAAFGVVNALIMGFIAYKLSKGMP